MKEVLDLITRAKNELNDCIGWESDKVEKALKNAEIALDKINKIIDSKLINKEFNNRVLLQELQIIRNLLRQCIYVFSTPYQYKNQSMLDTLNKIITMLERN